MTRPLTSAAALLCACVSAGAWAQEGVTITPVLETTTAEGGAPLAYPAGPPQITSVLVEIAPGGATGRHKHPVPTFVYVLEGTVAIEPEGGERREYTTGGAFLEPAGQWHNGLNPGGTPTTLLVVFVGEEGTPVSQRPE